jgi:anti-sigma B factor antagonist
MHGTKSRVRFFMDIYEKQKENSVILQPQVGRLDAANSQILKGRLVDLISQGRTRIALDLGQVDFMDSAGLAALLSALKSLGRNGKMTLFGVSAKVRKLFTITRLDNGVFTITQTEDEAVQALGTSISSYE